MVTSSTRERRSLFQNERWARLLIDTLYHYRPSAIRDASDYAVHVAYIGNNPVKERLCFSADGFPYSSAHAAIELDAVPHWLKPESGEHDTARQEGVPFQSNAANRIDSSNATEAAPVHGQTEDVPFQSNTPAGEKTVSLSPEAVRLQSKAKTA